MNRQKEISGQTELEEQISLTLLRRSESVQVTSGDAERMKRSVYRKIEEASAMKKWNVKKIVAVAAAVCVLGSITAVAAGKITQVTSQSSHLDEFPYSQLAKEEKRLGLGTKAPEAFGNGYRFEAGIPVARSGMDQDGNVMEKGEDLSLTYKKDGQPDIDLYVQNSSTYEEERKPAEVLDHNGIAIGYNSDEYLFVPEDYQASDGEQAKEDAGKLFISYGADQVEHKVIQSVSWKDNGLIYMMQTSDSSMTAGEMAQMAGEMIDAK